MYLLEFWCRLILLEHQIIRHVKFFQNQVYQMECLIFSSYAFLEFESSEKMEAYYKTTPNLKFDGYLMTLHHIPANVYGKCLK